MILNAANREWGAKMHDDLVDAVRRSVEESIADPERVAIYGGSYGGYAALVGATFTPDLFRCAVYIVGQSNLITLKRSIPPYWKPLAAISTSGLALGFSLTILHCTHANAARRTAAAQVLGST